MDNPATYPSNDVTCAILAGGRGSRMGHRDKGLVELEGRPMIEHVIERVTPQVRGIVISANRNLDEYRRYHHPVVTDATDDFRGPLAGMSAALNHCATRLMVTVPCDVPLLPLDLVARLYHALDAQSAELAVAEDGKRLHPVFCLAPRRLADNLEDFLTHGGRKIDQWFERFDVARADFSDEPECFSNVNTSVELARAALVLSQ